MGRRRKGIPKDAPLLSIDVTEKQFDLLAWVYNEGYQGVGDSRIRWSPTAFRGSDITNAEAATLSKRVKTLVERGLLSRIGTGVILTSMGWDALVHFSRKRPEATDERTREMLELDSDIQLLGELYKVRDGFIRYRRASGIARDEAELTLKHLDALQKTVISQVSEKITAIAESTQQTN